jgi:quinol monooxygenase YgiN
MAAKTVPGKYVLRTRPRSKMTHRNRLIFLSLLVLIVVTFSFFQKTIASSVLLRSSAISSTITSSIFSLLVTVSFDSIEYKQQFLKDFKPLADYVKTIETDTLAYEVLLSDNDPLKVMILERYKDKENAYLKIHKSSVPFLAFRPKLQAMQEKGLVTISGNSYIDSGVGFGDRLFPSGDTPIN